jgi:integration host factor subunit beta
MIKSELVKRLMAQCPQLYERDVEKVVNAILERIIEALARGDRVEVRGFGVLFVKQRKARNGRNPKTGAAVSISANSKPFFRTGREMHRRLNRSEK